MSSKANHSVSKFAVRGMSGKEIMLSGLNPFDRSYHQAERLYDTAVITLICNIINVSMHVIPSPLVTQLPLYERNPNAWVVEQLVNGTADVSSTTLVLTPESQSIVDYSVAVAIFRPQVFFKVQSIRMANNIYFIPFTIDTWLTFLCLLLVITAVLTFILAREVKLPHNTPYDIIARIAEEKHEKGIDWNSIDLNRIPKESQYVRQRERWEIGEIFLVIIGAVCQQGSERDPNTVAARILLLCLFVLVVLVYTAFSASVISLISLLPATDQEQHTGWSVARNSQIILEDTNFFKYDFLVPDRFEVVYLPHNKGLRQAVTGKACFIGDRDPTTLELLHLRLKPELRCSIGKSFIGIQYQRVFAIKRDSPFKQQINFNILQLRQFGLLSREKAKAFHDLRLCTAKERATLSGFVSIDWSDIEPAFKLISFGWIACLLVCLMEYFIYQSSKALKSAFGKGWNKGEEFAEKVLNNWIKKKTVDEYVENQNHLLLRAESGDAITNKLGFFDYVN